MNSLSFIFGASHGDFRRKRSVATHSCATSWRPDLSKKALRHGSKVAIRQESDEMAIYQDASEQRVSSSFSLKYLFALRPTFGLALRGAIDIGCVWAMFAATWLLLDRRD